MLLVLALAGCSSSAESEPDWRGDARFTADERAHIEEGVSWLNAQVGKPPPSIGWTLDAADAVTPHTIRRERGPLNDTGECAGGTIYLDPPGKPGEGMRSEYEPGLAAHEMAHCELGFVDGYHPQDPPTDGIMRVLYPMRWTASEQAQWETLQR